MVNKKEVSEKKSATDKGRYYGFFVMTYNTAESNIQALLDRAYKWAWIKHDKDNTAEHLHIIVTFKQQISEAMIKKLVKGEQNTFCEVLKNKYKAYEYLTHENEDEDKAAYEESEIHCNDTSYFQKGLSSSVNNEEFILDLLNKDMTDYERGCKYGRDYIRNLSAYKRFVAIVRYEKKIEEYVKCGLLIPEGELGLDGEKVFSNSITGELFKQVNGTVDFIKINKNKEDLKSMIDEMTVLQKTNDEEIKK